VQGCSPYSPLPTPYSLLPTPLLRIEALGFVEFFLCFFRFALALEGVGLGAEESGGFGVVPGLGLIWALSLE
jgi:hypothetical protein